MANLTIYKNSKILEEKNLQVDSIEEYLATILSKVTFTNVQYIKNNIDIEVKVAASQSEIEIENNYNFAKISNENGEVYYYFVRNIVWTSKNCLKFILHLDVLNTYKGKYEFTNKTNIIREHKDRFISYKEYNQTIYTYLDNLTEWTWGTGVGEIIGVSVIQLNKDFINRDVTVTITTHQGQGADIYNYYYDKEAAALEVTAFVQGETAEIPQGEIKIQVVTQPVISNKITRNVDNIQEGIDTILFAKKEKDLGLFDNNIDEINKYDSHYLIYKTNNAYDSSNPDGFIYNNAVSVFYTSDEGITLESATGVEITPATLSSNRFYAITFPTGADSRKLNNSFAIDYPNPVAPLSIDVQFEADTTNKKTTFSIDLLKVNNKRNRQVTIAFIKTANNKIKVIGCSLDRNNQVLQYIGLTNETSYIKIKNVSNLRIYKSIAQDAETISNFYYYFKSHLDSYVDLVATDVTEKTSKPFREVDRTDVKLIKIIKLPYSMFKKINNGALEWNSSESMFRIKTENVNKNFIKIGLELTNDSNVLGSEMIIDKPQATANDVRNDFYESKLLHSDFHHFKFVYDNFNYIFKNEELNIKEFYESNINLTYCVSTNVSSSFLFDFSSAFPIINSERDYEYIMIVNRNLEVPIYNNYYLNYLRNGYNYDIKNKQVQKTATGISTALGIGTTVAGIGLAASGYGSALGAGMIVSGIATTLGSLTSSIVSSTNADRSLQQKQEQAQQQAATVQGADDIGLLSYYCENNKAKLVEYNLKDTTKKRVADLFFYCGYKCDYQGKPNTTTRTHFNFIQCNPDFSTLANIDRIDKNQKDELVKKYQEGVTVMHKVNNSWNFEQDKENWETFLID